MKKKNILKWVVGGILLIFGLKIIQRRNNGTSTENVNSDSVQANLIKNLSQGKTTNMGSLGMTKPMMFAPTGDSFTDSVMPTVYQKPSVVNTTFDFAPPQSLDFNTNTGENFKLV